LNPVFEEKLVFQVLRHETNYSLSFTVMDRDKLSGNDYIGQANFPLEKTTCCAPEADPETGLYNLPEPQESSTAVQETRKSRFRLPMSRSSSSSSLTKLSRPTLKKENSSSSIQDQLLAPPPTSHPTSASKEGNGNGNANGNGNGNGSGILGIQSINLDPKGVDDADLNEYQLAIDLKNKDKWEGKHKPTLHIRAKYLPYKALRQQFWRAMLKQYDADESGMIDKVELTTMLDTLGSTLHEATIDGFFERFAAENKGEGVLTFDQAVICLEDQLQRTDKKLVSSSLSSSLSRTLTGASSNFDFDETPGTLTPAGNSGEGTPLNNRSQTSVIPAVEFDQNQKTPDGEEMLRDELVDEQGEEHVVEIRECPICHQPRLNKKSDADIITHVATCASQDWRQVNNIVMAGFVTSSQAQRKWYTKVISKVTYGGYKLGANSANILVQDRITGQINEERMSVYVRLGIRLLYKGLKANNMEKKRSRQFPLQPLQTIN
jgi:phosphatidylserine decarboxylase